MDEVSICAEIRYIIKNPSGGYRRRSSKTEVSNSLRFCLSVKSLRNNLVSMESTEPIVLLSEELRRVGLISEWIITQISEHIVAELGSIEKYKTT